MMPRSRRPLRSAAPPSSRGPVALVAGSDRPEPTHADPDLADFPILLGRIAQGALR